MAFLLEAAPEAAGFNMSSLLSMAPFALIIVVFYFFMIRPESKKKKVEEMRSGLIVGDDVTTVGGIVGKIVSIKDDYITFETGEDRVRVQVARWAISSTAKEREQQ